VAPERGLDDVLARRASIQEVVQEVAVSGSENGKRPARVVDVAFAGADPSQTDPLEWERFGPVIGELENQYDLIVIDTPPIVSIPDAVPLLPYVGGVIVIGRLGSTPRAALVRLREQLETVDAPTLGAVVNSVGKNSSYSFGYGYGYGRRGAGAAR
jgi:Mrp family chromosome partitioning ATPase